LIVVDSSALIELLLGTSKGPAVKAALATHNGKLHAPYLLDIEILHVLRRYNLSNSLTDAQADRALFSFGLLDCVRYPQAALIHRIWELRHNLTAYDAAYVALAEALDAPLLTCDARLASSPGHTARIELV